jgi:uncharacterized protein
MAYIDTSLLVAYYCPEPLSAEAQHALSRTPDPAISSLVEVEVYSAVAAKVRTGDLDRKTAGRILAAFRMHLDEGRYRFLPIGAGEYALARDWIGQFTTPLRAADALHLAVAFANNLRLLTADRGLAKSAELLGVKHALVAVPL